MLIAIIKLIISMTINISICSIIALLRCRLLSFITTMTIAGPNKSGTSDRRADQRNRGANLDPANDDDGDDDDGMMTNDAGCCTHGDVVDYEAKNA